MAKKDYMDIKKWADELMAEYVSRIKQFMDEGFTHSESCEMVIKNSTLGAGYKSQIIYETKYYKNMEAK